MERSTQVWLVDPERPQAELISKAAAILRAGGIVAFPTETVYGLGANALDPQAVASIYIAKGRPSNNPLIVHVAATGDAASLVRDWPERAQRLAELFWPGPLTIVLPRSPVVPDIVAGSGATVAIRCPRNAIAQALIKGAGIPLAAPSANRSTLLSPTQAQHVLRSLAGRIDAVIDGGPTSAGIESTVVDISGEVPRLLRPGPISSLELEAILGPIERHPTHVANENAALPSPGMLARHYSPLTTLETLPSLELVRVRAEELISKGMRLGIVVDRSIALSSPNVTEVILPSDPASYAAGLYRALHELDEAKLDRLLVCLPPEREEWFAVRDRLIRAARLR